jgi:predicted P-loop ATPase
MLKPYTIDIDMEKDEDKKFFHKQNLIAKDGDQCEESLKELIKRIEAAEEKAELEAEKAEDEQIQLETKESFKDLLQSIQ